MDATDDEVEEALKAANAWEFVEKQPQGMDTNVGAGGNQLSGGQKQRLALARAFIKKPKMFIFDEATSALDRNNEREVQASIDKISKELKGVTSIVIAHRLSTVRYAEKICVMGKGVVVEEGTHEHLLEKYPNGHYANLCSKQQKADAAAEEGNKIKRAATVKKGEDSMQEDPDSDEETAKKNLYKAKMDEANENLEKKKEEI